MLKNVWPEIGQFRRFDVYWIQTNTQSINRNRSDLNVRIPRKEKHVEIISIHTFKLET